MNESNITIYTPESALRHPVRMIGNMYRDLLACRALALQLAVRDIRAQYRQAALGLLWAFILPIANTVAWLFIQASGVVMVQPTALPYPIYVFTGTILWAILMEAVNAPLQQITAARPMLTKINFPHEALVLSGIYQTLFNAIIKILVLLVVLLIYGISVDWSLTLFPLAVFCLVLAGTALGLTFIPLGMLYSDVRKGLPLLFQFFMYLTPIVFPAPSAGWAATLFELNPLTPLIVTCRDLATGNYPSQLVSFVAVNLGMALLLVLMWAVYRIAMPIYIERAGA